MAPSIPTAFLSHLQPVTALTKIQSRGEARHKPPEGYEQAAASLLLLMLESIANFLQIMSGQVQLMRVSQELASKPSQLISLFQVSYEQGRGWESKES